VTTPSSSLVPPQVQPGSNLQQSVTAFASTPSPNLMQQPLQTNSFVPSGSPFQPQQQQQQLQQPRGPLAPIPANQGLLQPLIPTQTNFSNFVPTRPTNQSPFQNPPSSFVASHTTGFPIQQNSFLAAQPTSFQQPQSNGFQPIVPQPTSVPMGGFTQAAAMPTIQTNGFGQTSSTTSFNPGFGQLQMNHVATTPPAPIAVNNTSPANIFAQMKSGTFATENDGSQPQAANKYDALRTNHVNVQPTGWVYQSGFNGFQG